MKRKRPTSMRWMRACDFDGREYERASGIIDDVLHGSDLKRGDIISNRKSADIVSARTRIVAALRGAGFSYPKCGGLLGMDHSSCVMMMKRRAALSKGQVR